MLKKFIRKPYYRLYDFLSNKDNYLLKKNTLLKDIHFGKTCFLLLTGEPLSFIDLELLKNQYTMSVGFIFAKDDIKHIKLNYYLSTEPGVKLDRKNHWFPRDWPTSLPASSDGKNKGFLYLKNVRERLWLNNTCIFLDLDKLNYYKKKNLFSINDERVFFLKQMNALRYSDLSEIDLSKRFFGGGGSIYNSLLILLYLGFKEIFLLGAGYTYEPTYEFHFYSNYTFPFELGYSVALAKAKGIVKRHNVDYKTNIKLKTLVALNNEFRGVYVRESVKRDWIIHSKINEYAKSIGCAIKNIVPDGFDSPLYDKVTWAKVQNDIILK